ncbi:caspase family protein [Roseibium aggregatum]|uniref:SEL1-like repeat protein n=1 Tax=Roseibium aggregatum TaxID=187304 RepID=A0A939EDP3_9HYPH|nr:caspase family protein [Roseibium aggregatum]MBN9669699.1 SEL1-like repeat protein [Roseibium aggregatum]
MSGSLFPGRALQKAAREFCTNSVLVLCFLLSFGQASLASVDEFPEKRLALVVGVSDYLNVPDLENTVHDGALIAETLKTLNFDVIEKYNLGLREFKALLAQFEFEAETADVALVYFAGHGVEVGGQNFLIPTDSTATSRGDVAQTSISLNEILSAVDKARQLRIVILDSCRNDPFAQANDVEIVTLKQSVPLSGLAPPSPERGTLVAYAAKAGAVALDGAGKNSPFAVALSDTLKKKDLEIGLAFRQIRDSVLIATNNYQEPHTYGSLSGEPYFLAGQRQTVNTLEAKERKNAWSLLEVDQEKQLQTLAQRGDVRALKGLAYMRLNPDEERYDPEQAVELLQDAVDEGDPEAMFELGRLYEKGIGVEQDVKKALELFHRSADEKFADAINDLGFLHFQGGLGVPRDQKKAIDYFSKAAELRHPEAMFNYAALIDDGVVEGRDQKDAAEFLYRALRTGNEQVLDLLSENPRMFKQGTRRSLQAKLSEKEFYEGEIDGQFGPQTKRGLRRAYGISE